VPSSLAATPALSSAPRSLPITEAEALLASLPGVISARIVEAEGGGIGDIHLLTGSDVTPKQTVRNVESALIAHFGMRVDHRKISVATTAEPAAARQARAPSGEVLSIATSLPPQRRLLFEDLEVRRSKRGVVCRVTLRRDNATFTAETEGADASEQKPEDVAARAALLALLQAAPDAGPLGVAGVKVFDAFGRRFIFVGVQARVGRGGAMLTGSCEVKDDVETASVLAVLDATNRWVATAR
jgi:hypothetical protein